MRPSVNIPGLLRARAQSVSPLKPVTEGVDNSLQAGATHIYITVDEPANRVVVEDNGCGMDLATLTQMHNLYTPPTELSIGKYGIGSACFMALSPKRTIYTHSSTGDRLSTHWDPNARELPETPHALGDWSTHEAFLEEVSSKSGTSIIFEGINWDTFANRASGFAKEISKEIAKRYRDKILTKHVSFGVFWISGTGKRSAPPIKAKAPPQRRSDMPSFSAWVGGYQCNLFVCGNKRTVREVGIDVIRNDIYIDTIPFKSRKAHPSMTYVHAEVRFGHAVEEGPSDMRPRIGELKDTVILPDLVMTQLEQWLKKVMQKINHKDVEKNLAAISTTACQPKASDSSKRIAGLSFLGADSFNNCSSRGKFTRGKLYINGDSKFGIAMLESKDPKLRDAVRDLLLEFQYEYSTRCSDPREKANLTRIFNKVFGREETG